MESLKLSILDKPVKLLYILSELGDLTFNELVERSKLSRNTVSKYIKILLEEKKIEKVIIKRENSRDLMGYHITLIGNQSIFSKFLGKSEKRWLKTISERNSSIELLREKHLMSQTAYEREKKYLAQIEDGFFNLLDKVLDILEYGGEELGIINRIVAQIGNLASKFGEDFFSLPSDLYLYLAVIFIFFNSLENPQFHIKDTQFLEIYGQASESFKKALEDFKTHKNKIQNIIKDLSKLEEIEMIYGKQEENKLTQVYKGVPYEETLAKLESELSKQLAKSELIHEEPKIFLKNYRNKFNLYFILKNSMREEFQTVLNSIVKGKYGLISFDFNYEPYFFHENDIVGSFLNQRINDALNEELINKSIFGIKELTPLTDIAEDITEEMTTMHIIWDEIKDKFHDVVLEILFRRSEDLGLRRASEKNITYNLSEIMGFCPSCGQRVLLDALDCDFCKKKLTTDELIYNIKDAKEISAKYQALKSLEPSKDAAIFTNCKSCGKMVGRTWTRCPTCKAKLSKTHET